MKRIAYLHRFMAPTPPVQAEYCTKYTMARTITASLVLLPLLISLALGPIQNAPLASASAAASTLQQATQPGVGTARFLHESIFGVAPASDEECEYSLDGPITGPGTHAATGPSGLGFFFESHSHASVSLALNPNFVPPPGVERIELGFVTAIVPALSREYLVLGITTRTVNVDTTEINRVIFYDILGDDLLAELRFDPAAWAMGEFHNHSVAPGLTASESLRPDPEPAEFGPCAEACRIKYEVTADAYQQQADKTWRRLSRHS